MARATKGIHNPREATAMSKDELKVNFNISPKMRVKHKHLMLT
jgi:hypothetical protein